MIESYVRTLIQEKGLKYTFVASKIGMSNSDLSRRLSGKVKLSAEELLNIMSLLGHDTFNMSDHSKNIGK